jgi:hypothetical protein
MQTMPGKLDCTRSRSFLCSAFRRIHEFVTFFCLLCAPALAQPATPKYPEVAWLGSSGYCNPYFGFRLQLPPALKFRPMYLPVEQPGRHMLLALEVQRLDRFAELYLSSFSDSMSSPSHLAAKTRVRQARANGRSTTGPSQFLVQGHQFQRLQIAGDPLGKGDESSYYFDLRGHVLHVAIFSHQPELASALASAVEHMEFVESCSADSHPPQSSDEGSDPRLYYGPALPTDLVDSTLLQAPGRTVPPGEFSHGTFSDPALGVRFTMPPGWKPIPADEADNLTALMRDPLADRESSDRRRALFRACSRVIVAASDSATELTTGLHPALAIAAMPQGCVPDLQFPRSAADRVAAEEFATIMLRSAGVPLLSRIRVHASPGGRVIADFDGMLPYQSPGERLARRLSLRLSVSASGPWLIFVYSVAGSPAELRDIDSSVLLGEPTPAQASGATR